eukprot:1152269-Pelagomonas_calceolata.AAC.3
MGIRRATSMKRNDMTSVPSLPLTPACHPAQHSQYSCGDYADPGGLELKAHPLLHEFLAPLFPAGHLAQHSQYSCGDYAGLGGLELKAQPRAAHFGPCP